MSSAGGGRHVQPPGSAWRGRSAFFSRDEHGATIRYRAGGRLLALASLFRDRESLETELAMETEAAAFGQSPPSR